MADWTLREDKISRIRRHILETRSLLREVQANPHASIKDLRSIAERGAALEVKMAELLAMLEEAPAAQITDIWVIRRSAERLIGEIQALQGGTIPMPEMPYDAQSISKSSIPRD